MSAAPEAVWKGGRVKVSSGLSRANFGLTASAWRERLRPSSRVTTLAQELSEPAAAMVSTQPTGRACSGMRVRS